MTNPKINKTLVTLNNSGAGYYDRAAICDHIMQGHMAGTYARFNNPDEEVSAHFGVSSKGEIVQYVEMNRWAYANGVIQPGWDDTLDWLVYCVANKINPNKRTISIEHEGYPGVPFPESQYQASLDLHKYIIQCWPGIKIDRKHIIGHYQISPKDRANCPGSTFPFNRLIADLRKELLPMPDTSDKVPGPIPVRPEFTAYWFKFGGLTVFGYPISNGYSVLNGAFGKAVFVQWFERARFELQPDGTILLGLVGREARDWYLVQGHTI